jgi:hypothetical protein
VADILFIDYPVYFFGCNGGRYMYLNSYNLIGTINENNQNINMHFSYDVFMQ